jgi:hypothetical protein
MKGDDFPFEEIESEDTDAPSIVDNEGGGIPFFINWNFKTDSLFVKSVEEVVAGPIGGITSTREACSSKWSLSNFPILGS